MRNGKNILRMQADEEDVYHLMDLRELYFVLIGLGSCIEGIAVYFLLFKISSLLSKVKMFFSFSSSVLSKKFSCKFIILIKLEIASS